MVEGQIYDWFISYKHEDTLNFATNLANELKNRGYNVWFDEFTIKLGESITSKIEEGLKNSLIFILILSQNYFSGWSERERLSVINLFVSYKSRIVPVWYGINDDFMFKNALLLKDIRAIKVDPNNSNLIITVVSQLSELLKPKEQEMRIFEMIVTKLHYKFPCDPNLRLFLGTICNDLDIVKKACDDGANVNITDYEIIHYYNIAIKNLGLSDILAKWYILKKRS
jgi:hypothetical protein